MSGQGGRSRAPVVFRGCASGGTPRVADGAQSVPVPIPAPSRRRGTRPGAGLPHKWRRARLDARPRAPPRTPFASEPAQPLMHALAHVPHVARVPLLGAQVDSQGARRTPGYDMHRRVLRCARRSARSRNMGNQRNHPHTSARRAASLRAQCGRGRRARAWEPCPHKGARIMPPARGGNAYWLCTRATRRACVTVHTRHILFIGRHYYTY
jgi:hypothetical protein